MHVRNFFNSKYSDREKVLAKVDGPFVTMPSRRVLHDTYGRLQVKFQKQLHAALGFPGILVTRMYAVMVNCMLTYFCMCMHSVVGLDLLPSENYATESRKIV